MSIATKYVRPSYMPKFVPDSSCVLWLPGQDDPQSAVIRDRSGKGNNGDITGGAVWTRLPNGLWVLDFDGIDDLVNCGSGATLDDISLLSFECWIYAEGWGGGDVGRIWDKGNRSFLVNGAVGKEYLHFYEERWATYGSWATPVDSIALSTWYHVGMTYSDSSVDNNPLMYINGVSQTVSEENTPVGALGSDAANTFYLGNRADTARAFDGKIALPKMFNVIRTPAQIKGDYDRERHLFGV